jgi:hypothetical protein
VRLSRRSFLIGGGALATATLAGGFSDALVPRPRPLAQATFVPVTTVPIDRFSVADPDQTRFGGLLFRSGLELKSPVSGFGGFSALWRSANGQSLVAVADHAHWLRARVETSEGRLSGLSDAVLSPLLLDSGKPLARSRFFDTESLAIAGKTAFVGAERSQDIIRFDWDGAGKLARGRPIQVPEEVRELPNNRGLEAMAVAPPRSTLAGALVAIAERDGRGSDTPTKGFLLTGRHQGTFYVARSDDYEIADLAFLPSGDLLLLDRRFSLLGGFSIRLRRIAGAAVRPGALIDGPVLYESDAAQQIDNMEGLAVHREGRDTVLTLISDDNFNPLQRTLLLEFALIE